MVDASATPAALALLAFLVAVLVTAAVTRKGEKDMATLRQRIWPVGRTPAIARG